MFMAASWTNSQHVSLEYREGSRQTYKTELQILLHALPDRFNIIIKSCLDRLDLIFTLPMVLLHRNFGMSNVLADENSCHLTGVVDWAEAEICPFGQNLHSPEAFTGALHLRNGWRRFDAYKDLQMHFWGVFSEEIGLKAFLDSKKAIEVSRTVALLLSKGFTKRFANLGPHTPIRDDNIGRYNMLYLDQLLLNPATMFLPP